MNLYGHVIITKSDSSSFPLGLAQPVGLDKHIVTYIHHDGIIQSSVTALKILCAPPVHTSRPQPLTTSHFYIVSILLSLKVI